VNAVSDAPAQVVYKEPFEQLLKYGIRERLTPALKQRLKAAGFDCDDVKPQYPKEIFTPCVEAAREALYPGLPREEGLFRLGESLVEGATQTVMGKAMLSMGKLVGPEKTLLRSHLQYRGGTNFTEVRLSKLGERHYEFWMNDGAEIPQFGAGTLAATIKYTGGKDVRVVAAKIEPPALTFDIRWS
jgi:uncharacterized protein (TIGR02265 family)